MKKKYRVLSGPLSQKGKLFHTGSEIILEEESVRHLVGLVEHLPEQAEPLEAIMSSDTIVSEAEKQEKVKTEQPAKAELIERPKNLRRYNKPSLLKLAKRLDGLKISNDASRNNLLDKITDWFDETEK